MCISGRAKKFRGDEKMPNSKLHLVRLYYGFGLLLLISNLAFFDVSYLIFLLDIVDVFQL